MKHAANRALADHYVNFILSEDGQQFFKAAGFVPAISSEGRRLTEELEVKDVWSTKDRNRLIDYGIERKNSARFP